MMGSKERSYDEGRTPVVPVLSSTPVASVFDPMVAVLRGWKLITKGNGQEYSRMVHGSGVQVVCVCLPIGEIYHFGRVWVTGEDLARAAKGEDVTLPITVIDPDEDRTVTPEGVKMKCEYCREEVEPFVSCTCYEYYWCPECRWRWVYPHWRT